MSTWTLYGWELSYFSAKLRAYLRLKNIPFADRSVDAWTLMRTIPQKTGETVMPVLRSPAGEWLQDTTHIIQQLEAQCPQQPMIPGGPRQGLAARLIELWADEFWLPTAMHYRWSYPGNWPLFEAEAGRSLLPWAPAFLQKKMAAKVASTLRGYLPSVGVLPEQFSLLEAWTEQQLDLLEKLLQQQPYLLGAAPSLADVALIGPLYAHLGRDPEPKRLLIQPRPALAAWIERVHAGEKADGEWLPEDALAPALQTLLGGLLQEMLPWLRGIQAEVEKALPRARSKGGRFPRALGPVSSPMGEGVFRRQATPYSLWMMQGIRREWMALPPEQRQATAEFLEQLGAPAALEEAFGPALERVGLRVRLAEETSV